MARPKSQPKQITCKNCNNIFEDLPSSKKQFCSNKCAQQYKGFCNRYTPRKKKTKINQWGKKSLAGMLGNRVTAKQKPVTTGQMSLPFYQPELVQVSLNPIAEQALSFIQANRFNYQLLA